MTFEFFTFGNLLAFSLFPFQIYFDFSGYTDMAIGLALIFGINIPENFQKPYLTDSLTEFWQKWHITLSNWIRDYIYIPLGGSRKSNISTYYNLIFAMFVSGLWHGASFNFIFWGLLNGIIIALERFFLLSNSQRFFRLLVNLIIIFHLWIFFRVNDLSQIGIFTTKLYSFSEYSLDSNLIFLWIWILIFFIFHKYDDKKLFIKFLIKFQILLFILFALQLSSLV